MSNPNLHTIEEQATQESGLFPHGKNVDGPNLNVSRLSAGLPPYDAFRTSPSVDGGALVQAQNEFIAAQTAFILNNKAGFEDFVIAQAKFIQAQGVALRQAGIA